MPTFTDTLIEEIAPANIAGDYVVAQPTDWGTGKPHLTIYNPGTAGTWWIALYDGVTNSGTINFASTTLTHNGYSLALANLSNATYTRNGTGAVPIALNQRLNSIVNILDYGGGVGAIDNAPALSAALSALPSTGGSIIFPAGKFQFNSAVSFTLDANQSVSVVGAGMDATVLYWPNTDGIVFSYTSTADRTQCSALARDLTFSTGALGTRML
jgi:hypothetical protein